MTTPSSVPVDSTQTRTTRNHQRGSIQEQTSEKYVSKVNEGEELHVGHQSTPSTNQLTAVIVRNILFLCSIYSDNIWIKGSSRVQEELCHYQCYFVIILKLIRALLDRFAPILVA